MRLLEKQAMAPSAAGGCYAAALNDLISIGCRVLSDLIFVSCAERNHSILETRKIAEKECYRAAGFDRSLI
jgi:hypothetical protein